jgi:hypothetical protein
MPALLTQGSSMMCPHGGTVLPVTANARARAATGFLLRAGDTFTIAGCPFMIGSTYHACVSVQWVVPATRGKAAGGSLLTQASVGLCKAADQAVQGAVVMNSADPRAAGQ